MKTRDFPSPPVHRAARVSAVLAGAACLAALGGCGHMPWAPQTPQRLEAVSELIELAPDGLPTNVFPQYWKRNTLVVDLTTAAGSGGQVTLKPREGRKWPRRLAVRVMPGTVGVIEVQADQRLLMPVAREGTQPVDLELVPGVYSASSPQIVVKWQPLKPPPS